jgi:hypothetical protein
VISKSTSEPSHFEKLVKLLASDSITDEERTAFLDMHDRAEITGKPFSPRQMQWIDSSYDKHGLNADDVENLFSKGLVEEGVPVPLSPLLDPAKLPKKPPRKKI